MARRAFLELHTGDEPPPVYIPQTEWASTRPSSPLAAKTTAATHAVEGLVLVEVVTKTEYTWKADVKDSLHVTRPTGTSESLHLWARVDSGRLRLESLAGPESFQPCC